MERIKEALERAREERTQTGGSFGNLSQPIAARAKNAESVEQIKYTQTRNIKVSRDFMREKRIVSSSEPGIYSDSFKILRTQILQRMRENNWNALAITSPGENEGKTLSAINLAISLAMEVDQTVLLVDADLRHPSVHHYFGMADGPGLSDYLTSDMPLGDMLVHPGIGRFVFLPGGKPLLNSSEMLGSPKMAQLVQELKNRYPSRIVLFDLPPILSAADALAFSPYVDAALLVVEEARTRKESLIRAAELLDGTNLIGTVLNKSLEPDAEVKTDSGWMKRLFKRKG